MSSANEKPSGDQAPLANQALVREATLDALMSRLACGDRSAFPLLYPPLRTRAVRLAAARLGADQGADVAQAALLNVFSRASEFTPGRPCLPWFYAIVANEIRAAKRRGARLVSDPHAIESMIDGAADPESALIAQELERALELAIGSLDDDSADAIRAMLGRAPQPRDVNAAALRKRISRAYAKLRVLLGGHDVG